MTRYRVEPTGRGFWPYCVRAGDGTRELFVGHKKSCERVAAELATAFSDGEFVGGQGCDALLAERDQFRAERDSHQRLCITEMEKNSQLRAELEAIRGQQPDAVSVPGVHEFAVEILRGALEGGNFDGGDIQEMGVRHGLLFPEHRKERCGEYCECAEYGFPVECFRIARALLSTKNAEEGE